MEMKDFLKFYKSLNKERKANERNKTDERMDWNDLMEMTDEKMVEFFNSDKVQQGLYIPKELKLMYKEDIHFLEQEMGVRIPFAQYVLYTSMIGANINITKNKNTKELQFIRRGNKWNLKNFFENSKKKRKETKETNNQFKDEEVSL